MGRLLSLTRDQTISGLALVALATLACLSPVHNDTWWHLAYGREMAAHGGFGQIDVFSHTAFGRPFPNHQWLAERVLYAVWGLGGLPLLTLFCAALLVIGWVLCWRLTRGPLLDRLLVTGAAVAGSTLVWSIRPQVFTVALLPLVVTLLARQRLAWLPVVVLLWANLHGGVLLGLLAIGMWTAVALIYERQRLARLAASFSLSIAATLCTPLGLGYWPEVFSSLKRSQVHRLHEWQPPAWPPEHLFFWGAAATLIVLTVRHWKTLTQSVDRAFVATALLFLLAASRSLRNISPFMMVAAPALTRLLFPGETPGQRGHLRAELKLPGHGWAPAAVVLMAIVGAGALVSAAWSRPWARLGWVPLEPGDVEAIRACPAPIYNTYPDGGPIIWFVPGQPVFIDSRQDQFPDGFIDEATKAENGGDPASLFRRFGIRCAVLPVSSPTGPTLVARGWHLRRRSNCCLIFEQKGSQP